MSRQNRKLIIILTGITGFLLGYFDEYTQQFFLNKNFVIGILTATVFIMTSGIIWLKMKLQRKDWYSDESSNMSDRLVRFQIEAEKQLEALRTEMNKRFTELNLNVQLHSGLKKK